jgi:hypothetical protein
MTQDEYTAEVRQRIDALGDIKEPAALLARMHDLVTFAVARDDGETVAEFSRHLIRVASHHGRLDYELLGFGELRSLYQRNPNYADLRGGVLWYYKWIGEHLYEYADVPAAQVSAFLDQMEAFYLAEQVEPRPVHALRCRAAAFMGDRAEADRQYELWQTSADTESDDCPACQTHAKVQVLLDLGKVAEAIEAAEPVLSGEQRCDEVPATTVSRLLLPLVVADQLDQAVLLAGAVQRQVRVVPKLLGYLADHVFFAAVVGAERVARRLGFVMLARAEEATNDADRFLVARAAWLWAVTAGRAGADAVPVPLRCAGLPRQPDGRVVTADAAAFYRTRAHQIAAAFDERNGTTRFTDRLAMVDGIAKGGQQAE